MSKLTYHAVAAAAASLKSAGEEPTVRLIVGKLGGSNTTAMRMLEMWKKGRASRSASNDPDRSGHHLLDPGPDHGSGDPGTKAASIPPGNEVVLRN